MSDDGIFMIRDSQLAVLRDSPYESEAVLQLALAQFPQVLAGGATNGDDDRRLALIRREKGIPSSDGGSSTFSVDHLFVDPSGVPVIVEVKRSSDTRIRREVVGQMLDYAANGVKYWPVAGLRADFEANCRALGREADEALSELTGLEIEEFWLQVEQNLRAGRVRMVFVADRFPEELVRVIEFLNEQMSPGEVLGVEVKQFTDGTTRVLVPRLVGATVTARAAKERGMGTPWNEATMLDAASGHCTEAELELARRLLDHAALVGTKLSWGKGVTPGVSGWYFVKGTSRAVWTLNVGAAPNSARVSLWFPEIAGLLTADEFNAFVERIRSVPPLRKEIDSKTRKYPACRLSQLSPSDLSVVLEAVESLSAPLSP